jgi:hypothetical protein
MPSASLKSEEFADPRISVGILLAAPGRGGHDLPPAPPKTSPNGVIVIPAKNNLFYNL